MVHADERDTARPGERLARRKADQQRPDQTRARRRRDQADVLEADARDRQRLLEHRRKVLEMGSRGDLRDDPAVTRVGRELRGDHVGAHAALAVEDGDGCLVAGRLDAENDQAGGHGAAPRIPRAQAGGHTVPPEPPGFHGRAEAARVRRPADRLIGHDGRDVAGGRHVEGGVPRADAGRSDGLSREGQDLCGPALLDRDRSAVRACEIDGRRGRRDVERDSVLLREDGQRIRADLVRDVSVRGDAVGADDDGLDGPAREEVPGHRVGDQLHGDPVAGELPGRQARALEEGAGLAGQHADRLSGLDRAADDPERRSVARGRERSRVAVREHGALTREKLRSETSDAPAGLDVLAGDRVGLPDQGLFDGVGTAARDDGARERLLHPLERGEQVDGGGTRAGEQAPARPRTVRPGASRCRCAWRTPRRRRRRRRSAGAPRTAMSRIASAISGAVSSESQTSLPGRRRWSRRARRRPSR